MDSKNFTETLNQVNSVTNAALNVVSQVSQLRSSKKNSEKVDLLEEQMNFELDYIKKQLRTLKIALIATGASLTVAIIVIAILAFLL